MKLDCEKCGAQLERPDDAGFLECEYCGASRLLQNRGAPKRAGDKPSRGRPIAALIAATVVGLAAVGIITWVMPGADSPDHPAKRPLPRPRAPAQQQRPPKPGVPRPVGATAEKKLEKPPGPVVSRREGKKILEPEILACLEKHDVHYLIVRIGQGYDAPKGLYPPLTIVHSATVDYREVEDFHTTPLGKCVLEASSKVWADARRGAYMHFGVRNAKAKDPLAGKPKRLDRRRTASALSEHDEEARDCGRRQLDGYRPGRTLSMLVHFRGIDGAVTNVDPNYIPSDSPYGVCIKEAYGRVVIPQFRELRGKVLHKLKEP